jgi:hypothetical protein
MLELRFGGVWNNGLESMNQENRGEQAEENKKKGGGSRR